ncbi:Guanine nucleotide-binding protein subunit beta-like protein [Gossypium arboreum]|uniref:Guanine nucleotide-binding protein subunit beta-like protein n=1 Tax=Gossypium arboreum TaxID=29729 RepID=A0A0B0M8E3_GOSAR|nr:Guanine nucleotide-binding protein subunit beta-like protein [Gossypium arboreum]
MRLDSGIQRKERTVSELEQAAGKNKNSSNPAGSRSFAFVAEGEEVSSGQKVGRLQLFEITHRKKDRSPMTSEAGEIMEKLKEKNAEYEAIASTDSSVNLKNIDNRIITEVLGLERDQIAQMQASTVNQITEVQRKCEEIQQQLRADAVARKAAVAARKVEVAAMAAEQSRK